MTDAIPTEQEINLYGSLDARTAAEHFLGKNISQAEALFQENFIYYQEDLMFMGPKAFCYYVRAAMNYLRSDESDGDSDAANSFCSVVGSQHEYSANEIAPVIPAIRDGIGAILAKIDRFECAPEIYGDIPGKYRALLDRLIAGG